MEYKQTLRLDYPELNGPMREIAGFMVRPGLFDMNGAMALTNGVNFTVHTHRGTSCELLLFHKGQEEPFAVLPFPEEYRIGDVYSMIVFGLDISDIEYAYRVDGPYDPEKGWIFDKTKVLLDPYARAVAGQRVWGEKASGSYHARVVTDVFDWGGYAAVEKGDERSGHLRAACQRIYESPVFRSGTPGDVCRGNGKDSLFERTRCKRSGTDAGI